MALDKKMGEDAAEYGKRLSHVMEEVSEPLDRNRDLAVAIMADIGMVQGVPLATVGTHLGTIIGGGSTYGIDPLAWPNALLALYYGGEGYFDLVTETSGPKREAQVDYTESLREVCRACLCVVEGCISTAVKDQRDAMRRYLELLAQLISRAVDAAMGD